MARTQNRRRRRGVQLPSQVYNNQSQGRSGGSGRGGRGSGGGRDGGASPTMARAAPARRQVDPPALMAGVSDDSVVRIDAVSFDDSMRYDDEDEVDACSRRRRKKTATIMQRYRIAAVIAAARVGADSTSRGPTGPKRRADRTSWKDHVLDLGPKTFRRMYRMEESDFYILLAMVEPLIETKDVGAAVRSAGSPVCACWVTGLRGMSAGDGATVPRWRECLGYTDNLRCLSVRVL